MTLADLHSWTLQPDEAIKIQARLRERLRLNWDGRPVSAIGGVDMSLTENKAHAAVVVLRFPDLVPLEGVTADAPLVFPYIPGLLAFREGPAVLAAWEKLRLKPDLVMFDGQGIAHPRGMGIAAHMGLWLGRPTIGVAKSKLYGRHAEPGPKRGDSAELYDPRDPKRVIGAVLRSREGGKPLYISPGHLIDAPHSLDFVLKCLAGYRLPEPTRWAHKFAAGEKLPLAGEDQPSLF
jgi:deoxyribonuclease V